MSDSIWKKEISFSRKEKAPKAPKEPSESIWKKEISLSRKPRENVVDQFADAPAPPPPPVFAVAPSAPVAPQPHFAPPAPVAPQPPAAPPPPVYAVAPQPPVASPPPAPAAPVYEAPVEPPFTPQPAPPATVQPLAAEPVWAAEPVPVSSWPPAQPAPAPAYEVAAQPPAAPQPTPAAPVSSQPVEAEPVWSAESVPVSSWQPAPPAPALSYEVALPSAPQPIPVAPAYEIAPQPPAEPQWSAESIPVAPYPQPAQPSFVEPEPARVEPPAAAWPSPAPSYEPAPFTPEPQVAPVQPVAIPAPAVEATAVIGPPVSTDAEPPATRPTPFWRKELSLQRSPKAPKAAKAPKAKASSRPAAKSGSRKAKRVVGLKVGASQLAAACVSTNGSVELQQVARQPLEYGVVVNGELRDPDALAEALKTFFARNKLPKNNVRLGLATSRIGVRVIDITGIDDQKQLDNAVRFRAQEALPIPLDEAVLDYHVVGESVDADGQLTRRVVLVVAYRELVERYAEACRKAGLSLIGVDVEAFALLRALVEPRPDSGTGGVATVAITIGHDRSTFAVSDGRICEFTRVLAWGGSTLSVAVARALDLAPSEVVAIKHSLSLEATPAPVGIPPEQYALAVDAVRKQVQAFARELVSSLQFYQHQPGSLAIGEVVLTGGTAMLAGIATELQQLIGVRVRVGDPLARLKVAKKIKADEQFGSLAVAIGLGIED